MRKLFSRARSPALIMAAMCAIIVLLVAVNLVPAVAGPQATITAIAPMATISLCQTHMQTIEMPSPVDMIPTVTQNAALTVNWTPNGNKSPSSSLSMSAMVPDESIDQTAQVMTANMNSGPVLRI